jgi:hypothetical protein
MGVQVITNTRVVQYEGDEISLSDGRKLTREKSFGQPVLLEKELKEFLRPVIRKLTELQLIYLIKLWD